MSYVIAIDGPAASGKGTLARVLAAALGFAHMDTGALYRAVGWRVLQAGGNPEDKDAAVVAALILKAALESGGDPAALLADPALKSDEAGQAASKVAAIPDVRTLLVDVQKSFAQNPGAPYKGAVLDGRDIGTVICPQAAVKLFVIADTEIRAQRRLKELQSAGIVVTYEAVLKDMRERDARDFGRQTAPMKPAEDAIVLDTGSLNQAEILDRALDIIRRTLPL